MMLVYLIGSVPKEALNEMKVDNGENDPSYVKH